MDGARPTAPAARFPDNARDAFLAAFLADVLDGLSRSRKTLPCKHLYDRRGSKLFEAICRLPEYYPTRVETALLARRAGEIADVAGAGVTMVELGSGSGEKVGLLLDALESPAAYVPVDISPSALATAVARLRRERPGLAVHPVVADYTRHLPRPDGARPERVLVFFPGSTIGNFHPHEATAFLARLGRALGVGCRLVIGVDRPKDRAVLEAAYDDAQGVTAAFNRNLLVRINRELGGDFDPDAFAHRALWNADLGRVEMHLESRTEQTVRVAGRRFAFRSGETIHTENSYKHGPEGFRRLAAAASWRPLAHWTDDAERFSLHALRYEGDRPAVTPRCGSVPAG